jgi:hypothetical protein
MDVMRDILFCPPLMVSSAAAREVIFCIESFYFVVRKFGCHLPTHLFDIFELRNDQLQPPAERVAQNENFVHAGLRSPTFLASNDCLLQLGERDPLDRLLLRVAPIDGAHVAVLVHRRGRMRLKEHPLLIVARGIDAPDRDDVSRVVEELSDVLEGADDARIERNLLQVSDVGSPALDQRLHFEGVLFPLQAFDQGLNVVPVASRGLRIVPSHNAGCFLCPFSNRTLFGSFPLVQSAPEV